MLKQLHVISTGEQSIHIFIEKVKQIHSYVDFIHLRERSWTAEDHITVIEQLYEAGVHRQKIIVNDRIDIAVITNVSGVQLATHSIDVAEVKRNFPDLHVGCSIHSTKEAIAKEKAGANFLIFGHIFETNSKAGLPPRGLQKLQRVVNNVTISVIAIGGIAPNNVELVTQTGASGIAVMSGILLADDIKSAVLQYRKELDE